MQNYGIVWEGASKPRMQSCKRYRNQYPLGWYQFVNQVRLFKTSYLKHAEQKAECKGLITNVISLFGNSMYSLSLSMKRRSALKYGLNERYQSICSVVGLSSTDTPITKSLFGGHWDKKLKAFGENYKRYLGKKNRNQNQFQNNTCHNQYGTNIHYKARNARQGQHTGYDQFGFLDQSGPTIDRGRYNRANNRPYNYNRRTEESGSRAFKTINVRPLYKSEWENLYNVMIDGCQMSYNDIKLNFMFNTFTLEFQEKSNFVRKRKLLLIKRFLLFQKNKLFQKLTILIKGIV